MSIVTQDTKPIMPRNIGLDVLPPAHRSHSSQPCIALVGNPNAGKTTLFNQFTGLRAKTANFPGTTIEHRIGRVKFGAVQTQVLDLPGLYSLTNSSNEERIARDAVLGQVPGVQKPNAIILIIDATTLERNLFLASQVLELGLPTVVALNMIDLAEQSGGKVDVAGLSAELGCPVVAIAARYGRGIEQLRHAVELLLDPQAKPVAPFTGCSGCTGCQFTARFDWAERVGSRVIKSPAATHGQRTQTIDRFLTHPVVGVVAFLAVMLAVFITIFWIAQYPMDGIEMLFASVGGLVSRSMLALAEYVPAGFWHQLLAEDLRSLLVDGVVGGVGGVLVFLPQICILFFFLSLLEDTGYLARAAFVMDKLMRHVGLPGKAFVPMLSAHACAIPAIMSARAIEDRRDRFVTIMVLPILSCSARIPVYAMVVALLFPHNPVYAALMFSGAYLSGIVAMLAMAWVFKRTLLKGQTKPLVLELPSYKMPSLRNALLTMIDRAMIFVRKAGTVILIASVVLWALAHYPKSDPPAAAVKLSQEADTIKAANQSTVTQLENQIDPVLMQAQDQSQWRQMARIDSRMIQARELDAQAQEAQQKAVTAEAAAAREFQGAAEQARNQAIDLRNEAQAINPQIFQLLANIEPQRRQLEELTAKSQDIYDQAENLTGQNSLSHSVAGTIGHVMEPALKPLGMDWQMGIGILSSFSAREVFVSTLAIVYGVGADAADEHPDRLYDTLRHSRRSDGGPVFTTAACVSLLVFYVLAMQCLSTTAVVKRETGGWKWPLFQIAYMTVLAYGFSFIAYQSLKAMGVS